MQDNSIHKFQLFRLLSEIVDHSSLSQNTYFKEVKLIESIYQYSDSLNKKLYAPKKYYFNDLGMRNSFTGFSDKGSLVENAIFLHLAKIYGVENIFYLNDVRGNEVDFVVKLNGDDVLLIESKYINLQNSIENSLSNLFFKEIYGKNIVSRVVVTDGVDGTFEKKDIKIKLISLENFLKNNDEFLASLKTV